MPCPVSPPALQPPGRGEAPAFTIHLAADELEAQRAGTAAHHGVDADELGRDGRVEHVGLHGAIVHVPLKNLQQRAGLSAPALPQSPASNPLHRRRRDLSTANGKRAQRGKAGLCFCALEQCRTLQQLQHSQQSFATLPASSSPPQRHTCSNTYSLPLPQCSSNHDKHRGGSLLSF